MSKWIHLSIIAKVSKIDQRWKESTRTLSQTKKNVFEAKMLQYLHVVPNDMNFHAVFCQSYHLFGSAANQKPPFVIEVRMVILIAVGF